MAYTGRQFRYPAGAGGFNGNENHARVPLTDLILARNIRFDGDSWRKAPGIGKFDASGIATAPRVIGATAYTPVAGTQRIISAGSNGSIYRENAGDLDATTMVTGLTFTEPVIFVEAGNEALGSDKHLFMFSKGTAPRAITADGSTMPALTNVPADWSGSNQPAAGVYHDFRVGAWGNANYPHAIYFSNLLDNTDFLTSSPPILEVAPGFGQKVVSCFSLTLRQVPFLYVWKYPLGIYQIDTTDITAGTVPVNKVRDDIGGSGPRAVARVGNDVWFISNTGHVHSLTIAENSEDLQASNITARLNLENWVKDNIDLSELTSAILVYDENRQEVWAIYRSKESTGSNDIALVIDVSDPQTPRASVEDRGEFFETAFPYLEATGMFQLYTGGINGHVYKQNQNSRNAAGAAFTSQFGYADTDFDSQFPSLADNEKRIDWLEVIARPTGNNDLSVDIYIDGELHQTVAINMGSVGGALDSFILDTDRLGGGELVHHKVRVSGRGRRFGLRALNSGLNEDFAISELMLHFKEQGHKGGH